MSSIPVKPRRNFGKRNDPHTITISRNGHARQFTVNPLTLLISGSLVLLFLVGYFGATAYLLLYDDLLGASLSRHAHMQHSYEGRIADLRTQLDHVTSRHLLDQQAISERLTAVAARQAAISSQNERYSSLRRRAIEDGIKLRGISDPEPGGQTDPLTTGAIHSDQSASFAAAAAGMRLRGVDKPLPLPGAGRQPEFILLAGNAAHRLLDRLGTEIQALGATNIRDLQALREQTDQQNARAMELLAPIGVGPTILAGANTGGPFVPMPKDAGFAEHAAAVEDALALHNLIRQQATTTPLRHPVPGSNISSNYGRRLDPFHGRSAMHNGTDFRAAAGTSVKATASGTVITAERNGGYGRMVEISHPDGLVTRYAHLRRIKVKSGHRVEVGQIIGTVGSTGRSTGAHLHYEIRRGENTVNPAKYLRLGRKLAKIL